MLHDFRKTIRFIETHTSPTLSCCIDDGELGVGWYVDITDSENREAVEVGFFRSEVVAKAFCNTLKGWCAWCM